MEINSKYQQNEDVYRTIDLPLAAYLKTIGYTVVGIDRKRNKKKASVLIKHDENLSTVVKEYFDGNSKVEPRSFYDNVRGLKSQIVNRVDE